MALTKSEAKRAAAHYMWNREKDLSYKLDALQLHIHETVKKAKSKKICIISSRQIGKSYWDCDYGLEFLINNSGKIARIIAPTLKQCGDIVQDNLIHLIQDAPPGSITPVKSSYRWKVNESSSLRMGALERQYVDGNRGGNASLVIYEECGFVSQEDFIYGVDSVLGPQLLRSKGVEIFVSSPSEDPDHPLHTKILPECEYLGTSFTYMVFDSPSITPDMVAEAMTRSGCKFEMQFIYEVYRLPQMKFEVNHSIKLAAVHELASKMGVFLSEAFRREYLAEILRPATLMVVPAYNSAIHVSPFREPVKCMWNMTVDWGGVRDFTVALLHTYDYLTDTDLVWDELMWPANTSSDVIHAGLMEWEKKYNIQAKWGDVPGQLQVDLATQHDYQLNIPQKSDWKASVNAMSVKFSTNKILIHARCVFLQKSCRAGMFNKNRTDFERSPELGHCDALAALMYAIRSQDRSNPYTKDFVDRSSVFVMPKNDDTLTLEDALNPKRFGKYK